MIYEKMNANLFEVWDLLKWFFIRVPKKKPPEEENINTYLWMVFNALIIYYHSVYIFQYDQYIYLYWRTELIESEYEELI